ncbi:hypothetical protein [Fretibacter rubidus]|uniref:hypothetical protein n=1 Tax=Fretibacter rubidus TaxID=570162 RepID=UPI00352B212E
MNYLLLITLEAVGIMVIISAFAYFKAPEGAKLPMQWGLDKSVNWRAPKLWAVMFTPLLAAIMLSVFSVLIMKDPEVTSDPTALSVVKASTYFMAGLFVVIHAGHMYFALRDVNRG